MITKIVEKYSGLIASWKIIEYDQDGPNLSLKAEFEFTDGSRFVVRQVVLKETSFKYAYHWQEAIVQAPSKPGDYTLRFSMVQEIVAWFNDKGAEPLVFKVKVK